MSKKSKEERLVNPFWLVGLSSKMYKDAPAPPKSSKANDLLKPGGFIEWMASDGRKGALTGQGKKRRQAQVQARVSNSKAKTECKSGKEGSVKDKDEKNQDNDDADGWTPEDDKRLLDWKNEHGNAPWAGCAQELGISESACKSRFKKIKPAGWAPNVEKTKDDKDGKAAQKKGKQGNTDKTQEKENKGTNEWDAVNTGGDSGGNDNEWTGINEAGGSSGSNKSWGNDEGASGNEDKGNEDNNGEPTTWDAPVHNDTGWPSVDATPKEKVSKEKKQDNAHNSKDASKANNSKSTKRDGSRSGSQHRHRHNHRQSRHKNPSEAGSERRRRRRRSRDSSSSAASAHVVELKPDQHFSTDDLRLIARILHQDTSMVWERVSWRFQDKTGRYLPPELFEEKVTGCVEGKGSTKRGRHDK